jgi:hypothetical protein
MLATYVYNHCNIPIYFCNIRMKQLKHTSETTEILETWACNMYKKRPETLETQHRRAAMTYLVDNCGGTGSLDGARPHVAAMPAFSRGRGDAAKSREDAAGQDRGGPDSVGHGKGHGCHGVGGGDAMEAVVLEGRRTWRRGG